MSLLGTVLSMFVLLLLVFGGLLAANATPNKIRDAWRDLTRELP